MSVDGEVELYDGNLKMFGGTFDIGGGAVTLTGQNYTDPMLDLTAVRNTGRYGDVQVKISGTPAKMDYAFHSDDYPDQADIVSLLLMGKPASEMADSEGESNSQLMSAALQSMTGQVTRAVGGGFLGNLEVDSGAVRVGVPLSEKLFLSYQVDVNAEQGEENRNQANLEWMIQRRMYAEFMAGDASQSSADLYWRWRF